MKLQQCTLGHVERWLPFVSIASLQRSSSICQLFIRVSQSITSCQSFTAHQCPTSWTHVATHCPPRLQLPCDAALLTSVFACCNSPFANMLVEFGLSADVGLVTERPCLNSECKGEGRHDILRSGGQVALPVQATSDLLLMQATHCQVPQAPVQVGSCLLGCLGW